MTLYIDSRLCRHCGRDYLYPAYGSPRGVCNDCLMAPRGRRLVPIDHGTLNGYQTHLRRSQPPCKPCRMANAWDCRVRYRRRR